MQNKTEFMSLIYQVYLGTIEGHDKTDDYHDDLINGYFTRCHKLRNKVT